MATSNNPRKFSEKIALHNQKQAEETAAFEEVMKDLSLTRAARVRGLPRRPPQGREGGGEGACPARAQGGGARRGRGARRGGAWPGPRGQVSSLLRRRGRDWCPTSSVSFGGQVTSHHCPLEGRGLQVMTTWREQVPLHRRSRMGTVSNLTAT